MKKILFIIMLGLVGGAFASCTDMTTDANIDTNTRLLYISANPYNSAATQYLHTWVVGEESHTLEGVEVSYFGLALDKPLKFKLIVTNAVPQPITATSLLRVGVAGVTWEEQIYEIPAGGKSVSVPIKFIKDPVRVNTTDGQLKYYGWITEFELQAVNTDGTANARVAIGNANGKVYAKEMSVR